VSESIIFPKFRLEAKHEKRHKIVMILRMGYEVTKSIYTVIILIVPTTEPSELCRLDIPSRINA
jgi:hypothetical protein